MGGGGGGGSGYGVFGIIEWPLSKLECTERIGDVCVCVCVCVGGGGWGGGRHQVKLKYVDRIVCMQRYGMLLW